MGNNSKNRIELAKADSEELLRQLVRTAQENQQWMRFLSLTKFREVVHEMFEDAEDWELALYESLDGEKTTRELASKMPKSRLTILRRLDRWKRQGIVTQTIGGQYRRLASLEDAGLDIPEVDTDESEA